MQCGLQSVFCIQLFPTFFMVQVFQSTGFSGSRFQVYGPGPGFRSGQTSFITYHISSSSFLLNFRFLFILMDALKTKVSIWLFNVLFNLLSYDKCSNMCLACLKFFQQWNVIIRLVFALFYSLWKHSLSLIDYDVLKK